MEVAYILKIVFGMEKGNTPKIKNDIAEFSIRNLLYNWLESEFYILQ
jgi:hypothetical protein